MTSPRHRPQKVLARLSAFWGQVKIDFNSAGSLGDSFLSYPLSLSNGFPNMSIICIGELMWISEVKSQLWQLFHPARRARRKRGNGGPKSLPALLSSFLVFHHIFIDEFNCVVLRFASHQLNSSFFFFPPFPTQHHFDFTRMLYPATASRHLSDLESLHPSFLLNEYYSVQERSTAFAFSLAANSL